MSALYESELNINTAATYLPTAEHELKQAEEPRAMQRGSIVTPERPETEPKPVHRRRRWTHEEKKAIVAETEGPGQSISGVARKYGIAPRLLFSWRRQLAEEMTLTTRSGAKIVPISMVRDLEKRIQDLEEQLERKCVEIGALTKALELACKDGQDHQA